MAAGRFSMENGTWSDKRVKRTMFLLTKSVMCAIMKEGYLVGWLTRCFCNLIVFLDKKNGGVL